MVGNLLQNVLIRKKLFGIEDLSEIIIMTPIRDIYEKVLSRYKLIERLTNGWWNHKRIQLKEKKISFVKISQGHAVLDTLNCFDTAKKVILLGFCGGNSDFLEIGDVICPNDASSREGVVKRNFNFNFVGVKQGKLMHVNTFCEQNEFFLNLVKTNKISCVDMETFFLYSECLRKNIECCSLLITTDLLATRPFYLTDQNDFKKVHNAYRTFEEAVSYVVKN